MPVRRREHPEWEVFLTQARPAVDWQSVGLVLCLDPGQTTGWATFYHGNLWECGQWDTGTDPSETGTMIQTIADPALLYWIVYEEYRIRGNKAQQHVGSEVVTIQHIGVIQYMANQLHVPTTKQAAGLAKGFADDQKLKQWGLYQTGRRHANDAIRHGVYWHLFSAAREAGGSRDKNNRAEGY